MIALGALAGVGLAPGMAGAPAAAQSSGQSSGAAQGRQIAALDARLARLEAIREVLNLTRAFAYFVDRGLWRQAAQSFAADGTIEIGLDGVYRGPARIEAYLRLLHAPRGGGQAADAGSAPDGDAGGGSPGQAGGEAEGVDGLIYGQLNEWLMLQPLVTIAPDGKSASGRWRDLGMLGQYKRHASWRDGIYENTYVRGDDGIWRIASLHLFVNFEAPYKGGWARLAPGEGLRRSAASRAFAPDAPPTMAYQPFPAVQAVPFQAAHPVTGRPVAGGAPAGGLAGRARRAGR